MSAALTPDTARRNKLVLALLVFAAVAPFLESLAFGYVLDDTYAIRANTTLRDGWSSLWRVWGEQFGGEGGPFYGLYRPVTMTLFALVFNAGAKWPLWFHLVALALHAAATVAVYRLLARAVAPLAATLLALWFAVHPVHVEAVANITNTSEILVALWTCALAAQLWRIARAGTDATWRDAALAGALFLGAAFSKESGVMAAPVALLAAWGWHAAGGAPSTGVAAEWRRWRRVLIGMAIAVVVVAVARALVLGGPVTGRSIAAVAFDEMSPLDRVAAMLTLGPKILTLLVWPTALNPHYGPSTFPRRYDEAVYFSGTIAVLVVGILSSIRAWRYDRRWIVAIGWILMPFLPASNLLVATGQVLAERTLYVPSIGVAMLLALVVEFVARVFASRAARIGVVAVAMLVVALFAVRSARGTKPWKGHEPLFAQMIAADTAGYAGYWQAGVEATLQKRPTEGLAYYEEAYKRFKRDRGLILDLGAALTNHGSYARAIQVYRDGLKLAPGDSALTARLAQLGVR